MFRKLTTKEEVAAAFGAGMLWVRSSGETDMRQVKKTQYSTTPERYADAWGAGCGWWECYILVEDDDDEEG